VPDFITNHSLICSFKVNKRPPCYLSTGGLAPNCFVDQFDGLCIKRGAPLSDCDSSIVKVKSSSSMLLKLYFLFGRVLIKTKVIGPLLPNGKIGDMCCRDMTLNGVKFPKISTLCYSTQEQYTGTYGKNEASCPANLIENGFQKTLLEWHL
jgi:hypothetical protein